MKIILKTVSEFGNTLDLLYHYIEFAEYII